ncbi:DGQHR domain-containing protein [Vibrio sp. Isolate23]|uniref:DGQHR domain-containing protein n=1 Tax=Vibrio sp. Isolate23 TaxID=2908533 RepID=UPI001EFC966C|nr:DGQHR domain-containing protein [Vibrio sp. Isolate23]MCG9684857.1 DGQHR domain-containing protein [Vibrio sp. Isolate23]
MMMDYHEFYAFRVRQPFADYFSCVIPSDILRQVSYSLKAVNYKGNVEGVQRVLSPKRLQEIANYIDSDSCAFPNSIILGANFLENGRIAADDNMCYVEETNLGDNIYKLKIPKNSKILSVIDGQHRLYAFDNASGEMDLTCSIYLDLAMPYQAYLFSTINYTQGKVDKSLAYQLFGYEMEIKEAKYWPPETLAVSLVRILNKKEPLKNRVKYRTSDEKNLSIEERNKLPTWRISTAAMVEAILSLISKNPKDDRYLMNTKLYADSSNIYGRKILEDDPSYPLRKFYIDNNDKAIEQVLQMALEAMNDIFWESTPDTHFLKKTVGIACVFKFLKNVLMKHGVSLSTMKNEFKTYLEKIKEIEDFSNEEDYPSSTKGMNKAYIRMVEIMESQLQ